MLTRRFGTLSIGTDPAPEAAHALENRGFAVLSQVLERAEVEELAADVERVYAEFPPDDRPAARAQGKENAFRYEMLNRSAVCQRAVANPRVLEVVEPLLGEDCHVIANTAWRNQVGQEGSHGGEVWHVDAGPHVPRPPGTLWPADVPYPVFAIGAHFLLMDSRIEDGPTAVIPGSHRSGRRPPFDAVRDEKLTYDGETCVPVLGKAGDVILFVSDIWHRRLPTRDAEHGRFFLQVHYGRRDLAQRLRPTADTHQLSDEAVARAGTARERTVIGLHDPFFYDG